MLSMCTLQTKMENLYDTKFYSEADRFKIPTGSTMKIRGRNKSIHFVHGFNELINENLLNLYINEIQ